MKEEIETHGAVDGALLHLPRKLFQSTDASISPRLTASVQLA